MKEALISYYEQINRNTTTIEKIKVLVETVPNDMELGKIVRQIINKANVKK